MSSIYTRKWMVVSMLLALLLCGQIRADQVDAARGVILRLTPEIEGKVKLSLIEKQEGLDVFEVDNERGTLMIRGSSGVALCSGYHHYLREFCGLHLSWGGNRLDLPKKLPLPSKKTRVATPYKYRYNFNYCTFSYSMAFWDWERWQREIDWMALQGINMPLALTGQESVWFKVYKQLGLNDEQILSFLSGPAYFAWHFMGNLDGWGGPLPASWLKGQMELQKKILAAERGLGMTPVLPAFSGHVPKDFKAIFPEAKVHRLHSWGGFPATYMLDPMDPAFKRMGKIFLEEQRRMYGTDHFYSADTFNEMRPPKTEPEFLKEAGKRVYLAMKGGDPEAVWVMQGWLFVYDSRFWKRDRVDALLAGVPDDKLLLLDLFSTAKPVWNRTGAYNGKPWVWCMLHNWGGKQGMYGRLHSLASVPELLGKKEAGRLSGLGLTYEGIETNPVVYDLFGQMVWENEPVKLDDWIRDYVRRRYGKVHPEMVKAWMLLKDALYTCPTRRHGPQGSYLAMRPTLNKRGDNFVRAEIWYDIADVQQALRHFLAAADELGDCETYRYDLTDLGRQVLSDYSQKVLHRQLREAHKAADAAALKDVSTRYLECIKDCERLLAGNEHFLVGNWIEMARNKAQNAEERKLYEFNARNLITLWGDKNSSLQGYAQRQYGGIMGDLYYKRWNLFFTMLAESLEKKMPFQQRDFEKVVRELEKKWVHADNDYPCEPKGNTVEIAKAILEKYSDLPESTGK